MVDSSSLLPQDDGSTPIDPDEVDELIPPHLETRAELNQWEAVNISAARDWIESQRSPDVLSVEWLTELHKRMFDQTWSWAGRFRRSDRKVSPFHWSQVPILIREAVEDTRTQCENSARTPESLDEIAVRFHHRLVRIHPWPNGNGRHARLATDTLLTLWGRPPFSWGSGAELIAKGESRQRYLSALRAADGGDFSQLEEFVRS